MASASASASAWAFDVVLQAAIDGNLQFLEMMASEVDLREAKDDKGRNALHLAALMGHLEVCRFLVEASGLDVNSVSAEAQRPVHRAAAGGSESVLRYLLDRGGDPGMPDSRGSTPLHVAADEGHCEAVRLLLSKGVDVDAISSIGTPLHLAASKDKDQVLKILLEHGADPNKVVNQFSTPLLMACCGAHSLKCVKLLVEAGADVNFISPAGPIILMGAVDDGLTDIVKFLLEAGADPNIADKDGRIPITWAAVHEQRELVELLLPWTKPVPYLRDWSVDGILKSMNFLRFNAKVSQEEQLMAHFHRPNLTIFEEREVKSHNLALVGLLVVVKVPVEAYPEQFPDLPYQITHTSIQTAIQQESQILVPLENISRHLCDFLVLAESAAAATRIMRTPYLCIRNHILAVMPWTPNYGSFALPFDSRIPNTQTLAKRPCSPGNNEKLNLVITGMPPHFCSMPVIPRMFANICHVRDVELRKYDLTYFMNTYAPRSAIPLVAHVAIHKSTPAGGILNIWPIWIRIVERGPHQSATNVGLTIQHRTNDRNLPIFDLLRYTLYKQPRDGNNAGPSEPAGAHGAGHQHEAGHQLLGATVESLPSSPERHSPQDNPSTGGIEIPKTPEVELAASTEEELF